MKAVILAGGKGTRLTEETMYKPKPLVEIGGRPILWHIMKIYSAYGITDFIVCCGYKASLVKDYFLRYYLNETDITVDLSRNQIEIHKTRTEPWRVTLVDTGLETMTGGRLKRVEEHVGRETFCFTYGDGVSDVPIDKLLQFHRACKTVATVTATHHYSRFGVINVKDSLVTAFVEKPVNDGSWMNSGFFVLEPEIFNYISGDEIVFEKEPIRGLVRDGQLSSYVHDGFFQGMDSLRDRIILEELWQTGSAPWKVWRDGEERLKNPGQTQAPSWNMAV